VFLIPATNDTSFNRTTFDLRDKTLLKFEREKVERRRRHNWRALVRAVLQRRDRT